MQDYLENKYHKLNKVKFTMCVIQLKIFKKVKHTKKRKMQSKMRRKTIKSIGTDPEMTLMIELVDKAIF